MILPFASSFRCAFHRFRNIFQFAYIAIWVRCWRRSAARICNERQLRQKESEIAANAKNERQSNVPYEILFFRCQIPKRFRSAILFYCLSVCMCLRMLLHRIRSTRALTGVLSFRFIHLFHYFGLHWIQNISLIIHHTSYATQYSYILSQLSTPLVIVDIMACTQHTIRTVLW